MDLNIEKWKSTLNKNGEIAFNAYFIDDKQVSWDKISSDIRERWILVGLALAEKLCPHDDKFVSDTGNVWCKLCGLHISLHSKKEDL